jgi:acetylornithine deacetylase
MKGFFAVIIALFQNTPKALDYPVTVIATADEETTMAGARAIRSERLSCPAINIIGEPTGMRPILSHKGYLAYRIKLISPGGHSSLNSYRLNCIEAMHSIIRELIQWREKLQQHSNDNFSVPVSTLNFGRMRAGDALNRICAFAELEIDIRPLPNMDNQQLMIELEQNIKHGLYGFDLNYQLVELYPAVAGFQSSLSPSLVKCVTQCCNNAPGSADYVTEAPWFEQQGCASLVLGPGHIAQAHQSNEWVSLQQLQQAFTVYQGLLHYFCQHQKTKGK